MNGRVSFRSAIIVLGALAAFFGYATRHHAGNPGDRQSLFPGFTADALPGSRAGLVITSLRTDGAAERAGIAVGDEIQAIDSHAVHSLKEAEEAIGGNQGNLHDFRILHDSQAREIVLPDDGMTTHGA